MDRALLAALALMSVLGRAAFAAHEDTLAEIIVYGQPLSPFNLQSQWSALAETNTALLLKRVPGANVNFNGTLAGIAQYRGMYGARVNVLVDGMDIANACSNNMDAPLHYLPRTFVEKLEVVRGISPVSAGMETIGGTVVADARHSDFAAGDALEMHGNLAGGVQSVDTGYSASALATLANRRHRLHLGASYEAGDDRDFGAGTVRPTEYRRSAVDVGYGWRHGGHELAFDYRRNDTSDAGTPALPMDDIYSDANLLRAEYRGRSAGVALLAKLYYTDLDHRMSNYELRRAAAGRRRFNEAASEAVGYRVQAGVDAAGGTLVVGTDGHLLDYRARLGDPDDAGFFLDNFNDVERNRYGIFAEWTADPAARWGVRMGLRWTRVTMDAGIVDASMAMMSPALRALRDRFNDADRDVAEDLFDLVAGADYRAGDQLTLIAGVARKGRAPGYQERYLWSPLEATGGLSDGNLYVGNLDLDPEHAWQFEVGADWRDRRAYLAPRVFYQHVDDYIQGVPATDPRVLMLAAMSGDPTPLRYANVDARLWGVDASFGVQPAEYWFVDGVLSWVRGERRDIDDDLFRIAPLNALVDLSYRRARWSVTVEGVFYAGQERVSRTNDETPSPGYALLNLYGQYAVPAMGATLSAGVENVLDKNYRPHLNGINRVAAGDVAFGARLPGDGVNGFVQLAWTW